MGFFALQNMQRLIQEGELELSLVDPEACVFDDFFLSHSKG